MSVRIRVSQVIGGVNAEDVQKGWEIRHKGRWRKVIHVVEAARRAHHPNYQPWHVYVEGRNTPLAYIRGTSVTVMAPIEGTEDHPFLPKVAKVDPDGETIYINPDQARLLMDAMRVYFPDFEDYETGRFMKSLRGTLASIADRK